MRFVIQRVTEATCEVDQEITGQITNGFCVLIGIAETDTKNIADKMILCGLPEGKPSIFYQSRKSGTCKQSLRIYYCKMQRRNSGCTNRNLWCRYENFSDKRRAFYHIAGF